MLNKIELIRLRDNLEIVNKLLNPKDKDNNPNFQLVDKLNKIIFEGTKVYQVSKYDKQEGKFLCFRTMSSKMKAEAITNSYLNGIDEYNQSSDTFMRIYDSERYTVKYREIEVEM